MPRAFGSGRTLSAAVAQRLARNGAVMRTYAATMTIILRPGAAQDAAEASTVLQGILDQHPEILDSQYAKVNGELKVPQELEIDLPVEPARGASLQHSGPHRLNSALKRARRGRRPALGEN